MDTAAIVERLGGGKPTNDGWYMTRCPAHDDRSPSLGIKYTNGKLSVKCHAGCSKDDVKAALRSLGIASKNESAPHTNAFPSASSFSQVQASSVE
ncbi:MAG: hypothetical protein KDD60_11835, partial [Bdellovibrionales bacterium]|nr:hypothetical protein [Bdellovibrionales bacterium]